LRHLYVLTTGAERRSVVDVTWNHQVTPAPDIMSRGQPHIRARQPRRSAGYGYQPSYDSSNFFRGRYDTLNARTDLWLTRGNLLTAGYEWERESYRNHATDQNPSADFRTDALTTAQQRSHAVFVQDQARFLNDRLQLSVSGRIQHFNLLAPTFAGGAPQYQGAEFKSPQNAYTGDAAVSYYIPSSGTKLRAHAGNGYRAPALYERVGASFFFGSFSAYGDPR